MCACLRRPLRRRKRHELRHAREPDSRLIFRLALPAYEAPAVSAPAPRERTRVCTPHASVSSTTASGDPNGISASASAFVRVLCGLVNVQRPRFASPLPRSTCQARCHYQREMDYGDGHPASLQLPLLFENMHTNQVWRLTDRNVYSSRTCPARPIKIAYFCR